METQQNSTMRFCERDSASFSSFRSIDRCNEKQRNHWRGFQWATARSKGHEEKRGGTGVSDVARKSSEREKKRNATWKSLRKASVLAADTKGPQDNKRQVLAEAQGDGGKGDESAAEKCSLLVGARAAAKTTLRIFSRLSELRTTRQLGCG